MIRAINRLLLLILITGSLYSMTRQVNIYLMEYDNLNQSIRYITLGRELPNLVKEEFSSIEGVSVKYAGTIKPYLNTEKNPLIITDDLNLLLMGSYSVKDKDITVYYELIDLENWAQIFSNHITVPIKDIGVINYAFINRIRDVLRPFIPETAYPIEDAPDVNAEIESIKSGKKSKTNLISEESDDTFDFME